MIASIDYTQPLTLVFLTLAMIGVWRLRHDKRSRVATFGILGLLLLSWPPMDWLLSRPLEASYPVRPFQSPPPQAIVVLSSAVSPPQYERPFPLADAQTYQRCLYAAWLHKQWPHSVPVLACGGPGTLPEQPYSVVMRQMLKREGVPEDMIWTEERSRTTHENAVFGAEILRAHGIRSIALVVEAQSMLRAAACFRKQGIVVVPAPCAFRELGPWFEELIPSWKAIKGNEATLHEIAGLAWYWLRGWI